METAENKKLRLRLRDLDKFVEKARHERELWLIENCEFAEMVKRLPSALK